MNENFQVEFFFVKFNVYICKEEMEFCVGQRKQIKHNKKLKLTIYPYLNAINFFIFN